MGGSLTDSFSSPIDISIYLANEPIFRHIADFHTPGAAAQYAVNRGPRSCNLGAGIGRPLSDANGGARLLPRKVEAVSGTLVALMRRPPRISAHRHNALKVRRDAMSRAGGLIDAKWYITWEG